MHSFAITRRTVAIIIVLVISLAVPITLSLVSTRQDLRQNASESATPVDAAVQKRAGLLRVNQKLSAAVALSGAQLALQRQNRVQQEAQKRNIAITIKDIDKKAASITQKTNKQTVLRTIQRYSWTEADWKAKIAADLLEDKLAESIDTWRDYQLLIVRWDDPAKPKFANNTVAWTAAKPILDKARERIIKGESIKTIYDSLLKDKMLPSQITVQAITKTQRMWSYTAIPSLKIKQDVLSMKPNALGTPENLTTYGVLIRTFAGNDGKEGSVDSLLQSKQSLLPNLLNLFPQVYAASIEECEAIGELYCPAYNNCYTEGVIVGGVYDDAGEPIAGVQVSAAAITPEGPPAQCACTGGNNAATSVGDGTYDIHGLCCYRNPYVLSASIEGYTCDSPQIDIANGTASEQDITCHADEVPTPEATETPIPTPVCEEDEYNQCGGECNGEEAGGEHDTVHVIKTTCTDEEGGSEDTYECTNLGDLHQCGGEESPTPTETPVPSTCPIPSVVSNVRVTCPYCQ